MFPEESVEAVQNVINLFVSHTGVAANIEGAIFIVFDIVNNPNLARYEILVSRLYRTYNTFFAISAINGLPL